MLLVKSLPPLLLLVGRKLAQALVAPLELVLLVLRQTAPTIPFFPKMFLVLRRQRLPALVVPQDGLFFLRPQVAPSVVGLLRSPDKRQKEEEEKNEVLNGAFHG